MQRRIVDIETPGVHLSVHRGFLIVMKDHQEIGRVALDDIFSIIVHAHGASFSANFSSELSNRKIPVVFCSRNHAPTSILWPLSGNFEQGLRMVAQAEATRPLRKRLWKDLVKAKIVSQSNTLEAIGNPQKGFISLVKKVRSGDPDNIEAQAARRYWQALFGPKFRRRRDGSDENNLLNYGYTVLRAAVARSILGAGLHPSLSIQHASRGQALRLADDLMEPFRPVVDLIAHKHKEAKGCELTADAKDVLRKYPVLIFSLPREYHRLAIVSID